MGIYVDIKLARKIDGEFQPLDVIVGGNKQSLQWGQSWLKEELNRFVESGVYYIVEGDDHSDYYFPINSFKTYATKYMDCGVNTRHYCDIIENGVDGYEYSIYDTIDMPQYISYLEHINTPKPKLKSGDDIPTEYAYAHIPKYHTMNLVANMLDGFGLLDGIDCKDLYVHINASW